jgi:hypothetical protein
VAASCCGGAAMARRCGRWPERRAFLTRFIVVGGGPRFGGGGGELWCLPHWPSGLGEAPRGEEQGMAVWDLDPVAGPSPAQA